MQSRKTLVLTWNRLVLIKACRVQPCAAMSDKLSGGTCTVGNMEREWEKKKESMRVNKRKEWMRCFVNVTKWQTRSSKMTTSGLTSKSQTVHHTVVETFVHYNCTTYCILKWSPTMWHLLYSHVYGIPRSSYSLQQWISLISCPQARVRGTNQWRQLLLLCVLSMNTCSVLVCQFV